MIARLFLPVPPSTNALFVSFVRGGKNTKAKPARVKSDPYKAWLEDAGLHLNRQQPPKFDGDVAITYCIPRNKRRDIDNYAKPLGDLLVKHGVIVNDNRIVDLRLRYGETEGRGVEVEVRAA